MPLVHRSRDLPMLTVVSSATPLYSLRTDNDVKELKDQVCDTDTPSRAYLPDIKALVGLAAAGAGGQPHGPSPVKQRPSIASQ